MSFRSPVFTPAMKSSTSSNSAMSSSMCRTASLAPPWRGPYRAPAAAATVTYGSEWALPTTRAVVVEQFCPWSACRTKSMSRASRSTGSIS